jgi:hypothetical protein
MYGICDNISVKSGLGAGVWSSVFGKANSPSSTSKGSHRFCDAAVTFLVTFALRRTSGLSRTAAGAANTKLKMEKYKKGSSEYLVLSHIRAIRDVD